MAFLVFLLLTITTDLWLTAGAPLGDFDKSEEVTCPKISEDVAFMRSDKGPEYYIQCVYGEPFEFRCPTGNVFSFVDGKCHNEPKILLNANALDDDFSVYGNTVPDSSLQQSLQGVDTNAIMAYLQERLNSNNPSVDDINNYDDFMGTSNLFSNQLSNAQSKNAQASMNNDDVDSDEDSDYEDDDGVDFENSDDDNDKVIGAYLNDQQKLSKFIEDTQYKNVDSAFSDESFVKELRALSLANDEIGDSDMLPFSNDELQENSFESGNGLIQKLLSLQKPTGKNFVLSIKETSIVQIEFGLEELVEVEPDSILINSLLTSGQLEDSKILGSPDAKGVQPILDADDESNDVISPILSISVENDELSGNSKVEVLLDQDVAQSDEHKWWLGFYNIMQNLFS